MSAKLLSPVEIVALIAAEYAGAVDSEGRFPSESFASLKQQRLLGIMIPRDYGGSDASISEVGKICFALAEQCGSTGLMYAMHQIQVAMLLPEKGMWHSKFLADIAKNQLLLASVTSEEGIGGSVRTSNCAIEYTENTSEFNLFKKATTISYGAYADALLITSRKDSLASMSDQVLVSVLKDQYELSQTSVWDTMGMRGTCSHGFHVTAKASSEQISQMPFGENSELIMLPVSHILWSCAWLGIASSALTKARAFLRSVMSKDPENTPVGASRLAVAMGLLQSIHSRIKIAIEHYESIRKINQTLPSINVPKSFTTEMNALKMSVSEMALSVVNESLMICGISGFKNGTQYSLSRHLRDIHSARLMISNDRIASGTANFLIAQRSPIMVF